MWPQLVYMVVMMIISYAIQMSMAPKPQDATAGALDIPEPAPGALIGVCFGTNLIKSANVIWYGDANTIPIRAEGGK